MMKNKPVILVVDDQLNNILLLEGFLVRGGYEIIQAESGQEALDKLSGNQVDLVLLDVKMPGMWVESEGAGKGSTFCFTLPSSYVS